MTIVTLLLIKPFSLQDPVFKTYPPILFFFFHDCCLFKEVIYTTTLKRQQGEGKWNCVMELGVSVGGVVHVW